MREGKINGEPYSVPDGFSVVSERQLDRYQLAFGILADLDRSPAGRHKGDVEYQDATGISQGNPLLPPGTHIGHTTGGHRIVVPEHPADVDAWVEAPDAVHAWRPPMPSDRDRWAALKAVRDRAARWLAEETP